MVLIIVFIGRWWLIVEFGDGMFTEHLSLKEWG